MRIKVGWKFNHSQITQAAKDPVCTSLHFLVESLLQQKSLTAVNVSELRSLSLALLDALRDKNLELNHQKKANK